MTIQNFDKPEILPDDNKTQQPPLANEMYTKHSWHALKF